MTLLCVALQPGETSSGAADASRFMETVLDKIQSFGGQVDELSPRGAVAAFGLEPEEDAPQRAAHVAIALQKAAARARASDPTRPLARLAIHTDMVSVGRLGDRVQLDADSRRASRAVLDSLIELAEPGTGVVSNGAALFLARRFELVPATATANAALPVYRLGSHAVTVAPSRFVGRTAELRLLVERLAHAESGRGQIVSLAGDPGIGKSRLLHELHRDVGNRVTWMEGQAVAYGRPIPFHSVVDLVRRACHIDEADPAPTIAAKLEHRVASLGEDLRPTLPGLRYLLSVQVEESDAALLAVDPKLRRVEVFDALRRLFIRAAERRPLVVVFEDMHWADTATEEWLGCMADSLATRRILLILTFRPGYAPPVADRTFHTRLALSTLSTSDSVAMARALLADEPVPDALEKLIVRQGRGQSLLRRGGRPFAPGDRRGAAHGVRRRPDTRAGRDRRARHGARRHPGPPGAPRGGAPDGAAGGVGDRAGLQRPAAGPARRRGRRDRGGAPGAEGHRADLREGAVAGAGLHIPARAHPGSRLQLAPGASTPGAPSRDRADHRGAVRRSARRALRRSRPSLPARRGVGVGLRVPDQGGREGGAQLRDPGGSRAVRRGAGSGRPTGRGATRARPSRPSIAPSPCCTSCSATSSDRAPRRSACSPSPGRGRPPAGGRRAAEHRVGEDVGSGSPGRGRRRAGGHRRGGGGRGPASSCRGRTSPSAG